MTWVAIVQLIVIPMRSIDAAMRRYLSKKRKVFRRWQVQESFGGGCQADVYIVTDSLGEHDGKYALKRLKNPKRVERFTREILALRELKGHPNIVALIDADPGDAPSWFVMGLGTGSLEKCAPEGGYPIEQAICLAGDRDVVREAVGV
jgi:hypothetical protein